MYILTTRFIHLVLLISFLGATTLFGQTLDFRRVITDQPNYSANFLSGLGLADGGSLMVGTGLVNTSNSLEPSRAVGLYRFDRLGDLEWSQAYPEPNLLNTSYLTQNAAKLTLVDDRAYVLAVKNPASGSTAYPMTLRQVDPLTGAELSVITLEADGPRDSLGPPVSFAVIEGAAVLIRDDYERYPRPTTSTVQVFGIDDGQLRVSLPKERYFEENATAWTEAGLVFIAGAEPFGIFADGDTLAFPLSIAPSPENGVHPFVALGNKAVYTATQGAAGNDVLVTATTNGTDIITAQVALPSPLAQGSAYDLSAWGRDSFAMTVRGPDYPLGVFLFDADGSGGRELLGLRYLLTPHYIDGPKYGVLAEHTSAPQQRRVLARQFWSGDPVGLVNYVKEDTVALPIPLSNPRPEFFDDILTSTQTGPDEILGYRSLPDGGQAWVKFDRHGESIALPQGASLPRFLFSPKLTRLPGGRGFLLHDGYTNWPPGMAYLYDNELVLQDSVEMAGWGDVFYQTVNHPDGGVVFAVQFDDSIVVRHLTKDCEILNLSTLDPADFVAGRYYVNALAVGPQLEIALAVGSNLTREPNGQVIARDADGALILGATLVQREQRSALAWSPSGSLLIYERAGGNYRTYKPDTDGSFQLALTGQLSTDSIGVTNLLYLDEDELLVSFTDQQPGEVPFAALARYRIPERTFRVIHLESEESYGYKVELSEDRKILQEVSLRRGFRAVVLSQGSISSNREPRLKSDTNLMARSPFTDAIYFSFSSERPFPEVVVAKLFDAVGRLVHQAVAEPLADGQYHLQIPTDIPAGTYVLQLGDGQVALCVKQ